MIKLNCKYCNQSVSAEDSQAGKSFDCPSCSKSITVPPKESYRLSERLATLALLITSITFCILYIKLKNESPESKLRNAVKEVPIEKIVEVIKEVEVEKEVIKEVEKEIIKEVERELTDNEKKAIVVYEKFLDARKISRNESLSGLTDFRVEVSLNDATKGLTTEKRLKNKLELFLRKHNLPIKENSNNYLLIEAEGLWNKEKTVISLIFSTSMNERVNCIRNGSFVLPYATVWRDGSYGYAGSNSGVESFIIDALQEKCESFANTYIAKNPKQENKRK